VVPTVVTEVNAHRTPSEGRFSWQLDASTRRKRRAVGTAKAKALRKLPGAWGEVQDRVPTVPELVQPGRIETSPRKTAGLQGATDVTDRKLCQVLAMSLRTTSAKLGLEASGGVVGEAVLTDGGCNQLGNVRWRQSRCSDSTQCSIFTGKTRADERQTRHLQQSSVDGVALADHSAFSQHLQKSLDLRICKFANDNKTLTFL
jgi:hypothetical protein